MWLDARAEPSPVTERYCIKHGRVPESERLLEGEMRMPWPKVTSASRLFRLCRSSLAPQPWESSSATGTVPLDSSTAHQGLFMPAAAEMGTILLPSIRRACRPGDCEFRRLVATQKKPEQFSNEPRHCDDTLVHNPSFLPDGTGWCCLKTC